MHKEQLNNCKCLITLLLSQIKHVVENISQYLT